MSPPASQADVILERKFLAGWGMGREETFLVVPHAKVCSCEHTARTDSDVRRFMAGWVSCTPSVVDLAGGESYTPAAIQEQKSLCGQTVGGYCLPSPWVKSSPRSVAHNGSLLCSISICVHVWDAWQHASVAGHNRIPAGPASHMPQPH